VSRLRGNSVFCIGDDLVHLNLRCSLLREHGCNVLSSGSGHEGVIRFGQETVDAVVLDLDGDGSEAALIAGELKRQRPEIPVIMLVADAKDLVPGSTDQADAVVAKSQETRTLVDAMKAVLEIA